MACLAIAMTLVVGWARIAVLENRQARSAEDRLQAEWLAESAIGRAAAQLLVNTEYQGETWQVTAADVGRLPVGSATPETEKDAATAPDAGSTVLGHAMITVERLSDRPGARRIRVRADFPIANAAGTTAGVATNRISKQTVFDFAASTTK
jgi:Tfp pilus assembly protein PilX